VPVWDHIVPVVPLLGRGRPAFWLVPESARPLVPTVPTVPMPLRAPPKVLLTALPTLPLMVRPRGRQRLPR
jgi:hypothetical protein